MYDIVIEYTEGVMYHGSFGVRCDIYGRNGGHFSYGWGGDRDEALFFAEDSLYRNFDIASRPQRFLGLDAPRRIGNVLEWADCERSLLSR